MGLCSNRYRFEEIRKREKKLQLKQAEERFLERKRVTEEQARKEKEAQEEQLNLEATPPSFKANPVPEGTMLEYNS